MTDLQAAPQQPVELRRPRQGTVVLPHRIAARPSTTSSSRCPSRCRKATGPDAERATWKLNGTLRITTTEHATAA